MSTHEYNGIFKLQETVVPGPGGGLRRKTLALEGYYKSPHHYLSSLDVDFRVLTDLPSTFKAATRCISLAVNTKKNVPIQMVPSLQIKELT